MALLALLRHGQSAWNLQNRFTGWVDVPLTEQGEAEARRAGELFRALQLRFDRAYTSVLERAIRTNAIALEQSGQPEVPTIEDWRLNERHYGGLTGLDKAETTERHGAEQVQVWRRSYDTPPPPMQAGGEHDFAAEPRYAAAKVPDAESLKMTLERVLPYWTDQIAPRLAWGEQVLVTAHGNSLRAIVKHLFQVPDDQIVGVEIPTGNPLLIDLDSKLNPTAARYLDAARQQALPPLPA